MNTQEILGPGGLLAQHVQGYEHRDAQLLMAALVERCIAEERDAVIEAGTGTGKSLGYLVPAILSGQKAIVSTANKTLQAQLIDKDLPMLQSVLPVSFDFCVAKGKGNYVCRSKVHASIPELSAVEWDWLHATTTGDIDECPDVLTSAAQKALCAGDDCHSRHCKHFGQCYYYNAKAERKHADVVVCNHALLCQYLRLHGEAGFLPTDARILIVDEAHQLEGYAINAESMTVSPFSFQGPAAPLRDDGEAWLQLLAEGRIQGEREQDALIPSRWVFLEGEVLAERLEGLDPSSYVENAFESLEHEEDTTANQARLEAQVAAAENQLNELAAKVRALSSATEPGTVRHVQYKQRDGRWWLVGEMTRYNVSELLASAKEQFHTIVYTSATLSTGNDFSYFVQHNGVQEKAATLQLDSPFDFRKQCLLYLPATMPEPDWQHRDVFDEAARQQMQALVTASRGGALLLFTSYVAMNAAADYLAQAVNYPVRRQGEAGRAALIDWLKARDDGVLCATASFWEGVDVPGNSLHLVVIDKLPFAQPSPVEQARVAEAGPRAFVDLTLPEVTLRLKQGFGRLIRTRSDYGVVAILDPRPGSSPTAGASWGPSPMRWWCAAWAM